MQAGGKEICVTFTSKRGSVRTLAAADLLGDWFISPDGAQWERNMNTAHPLGLFLGWYGDRRCQKVNVRLGVAALCHIRSIPAKDDSASGL